MPTVAELMSANGNVGGIELIKLIIYSVKDIGGAKGDGIQNDKQAIQKTIDYAVARGGGIVAFPPGTYKISQNITVPINITVWFTSGAQIKPASGVTLTINGQIFSGEYDFIFDLSLGGLLAGTPLCSKVHPHWFGAKGDGVTDDTAAFQAAYDIALSVNKKVFVPSGEYRINSTIQINEKGFAFIGNRHSRFADTTSTVIEYYGTGELFQLGTDDGTPWESADYEGGNAAGNLEGFTLKDISLIYRGTNTAALQSHATKTYGLGTTAVKDWKSGEMIFENVYIEGFEYAFWGIQSDINSFTRVNLKFCKNGLHLGPRSDQNTIEQLYAQNCDQVLTLDSCTLARIKNSQFVDNGAASIKIKNTYNRNSGGHVITDNWFEHFAGSNEIESFIEIDGTYAVNDIKIHDNTAITNPQANPFHAKYFCAVGNADRIYIENTTGVAGFANFLGFKGSTSPNVFLNASPNQNVTYANNGTGVPQVYIKTWGSGSQNQQSPNGRAYFSNVPANVQRDFYMGASANKTLDFVFPSTGDGNTKRLNFQRRIVYGVAAPVALAWDVGDLCFNNATTDYSKIGWVCTAAGTPGTWQPFGQAGIRTDPSTPPDFVGQMCVYNNGKESISLIGVGTSSTNDWRYLTSISFNNRLYVRHQTPNSLRDFYIASENDKQIKFLFPDTGDGNLERLVLNRRIKQDFQAPTTLTWDVGDRMICNNPTRVKNIDYWICITAGTPGTWQAVGTGNGTTAERPFLTTSEAGYTYWDTTLSKLILWNGSAWLV